MSKLSFEDYNFEVINIEATGENMLTINKNSINFDRSIADLLGYSSHVKPLLDRENKIFAIQCCKGTVSRALSFSKPETQQKGSIKIPSLAMRNTLKELMRESWKTNKRYQVKGTFNKENKAFIFDLNDFKELPASKGNPGKVKVEIE